MENQRKICSDVLFLFFKTYESDKDHNMNQIPVDFNCCHNMTEHLEQSWGLCLLQHHHNWEQLEPPVMTRCFPCVGSLTILFTAVSSQIRSTKKSRCQYLITFQCWSWDKEIWRRLPGRCVFLLASQSTSLWLWNLKRSLGIGRTVSLQIQLKHWTVKVEVSQRACNSDCSELYQISQRSTSNLP